MSQVNPWTRMLELEAQLATLEQERNQWWTSHSAAQAEAKAHAYAECIDIVRAQPNYPDTKVGIRQQWVRDSIVEKIEGLRWLVAKGET